MGARGYTEEARASQARHRTIRDAGPGCGAMVDALPAPAVGGAMVDALPAPAVGGAIPPRTG